jgi:LL-diaminopimelate aminotransferase
MEAISHQYFASLAPVVRELQTSGMDVIRLDIGSPDLPPPPQVIETLTQSAAQNGHHGYQHYRGTSRLREAWTAFYLRSFGVKLDPEREVLPLLGSKEGIFHLAQALINPGDVALVPDPGYQTYKSSTSFAGGTPYLLTLDTNTNLPDLNDIPDEIAGRARLLWLNYPNNPTGAVAEPAYFKDAVAYARENNLLLCHDAAYTQVTYDGFRAPSLLEIPGAKDVAVEFNTLSKSHNMAGWRTGVVVGNKNAIDALYTLKTHADSGQFLAIMDGAVEALATFLAIMDGAVEALATRDEWIMDRNDIYRRRRDLVAQKLIEMDIQFQLPRGAIYLWFIVPSRWSSIDFTETLLRDTGVSLAPGTIFGTCGEGFARLSLCRPEDRLLDAMDRIMEWWEQTMNGGA